MNEDKRKSLAHRTLSRYISDHRKRNTPERAAVLDMILQLPSRFTIDELTSLIKESTFRVSRATVYNSVSLFCCAGILRKLHLSPDTWELTIDQPTTVVRLICRKCGKIREISDRQLSQSLALKRYQSFTPDNFEVCMTGYCTRCRPKDKKTKD